MFASLQAGEYTMDGKLMFSGFSFECLLFFTILSVGAAFKPAPEQCENSQNFMSVGAGFKPAPKQ